MPSKQIILVTGASGFLGAQVVDHLLKAGYAVRGTSRSGKADQLRKNNPHPDFDVAIADDIVKGDFSAALKGVSGVIHVASPLVQREEPAEMIEVAVEGTLNIIRQAYAKKVYKVVLIASIADTFTDPSELLVSTRVVNDKDWNKITKEEALTPGTRPLAVYGASKVFAERAAWNFAGSHPELDLTCLLPPFLYGPLAPGQVVTDPKTHLATNGWLYMLFAGKAAAYPDPVIPQYVDVRDAAQATVLALKAPPAKSGERKRILLWGGSFTWKEAVKHIASARPALKSRLVDGGIPAPEKVIPAAALDNSRAKEILGITDFIPWQKSVEDAVDSILQREPTWAH